MRKRITISQLIRNGKRAMAVAFLGLLLGVVAAPEASLAAPIHAPHPAPIVHTNPGSDSPLVP
jgi:hypothetical protein